MRRRTLLSGLAATGALSPVNAQQREKPRIVGIVLAAGLAADMAGPDPAIPFVRRFVHRLRDLGWVEGRNVVIERRTAEDRPERAAVVIAELIGGGAEVIVLSATPWLTEVARQTTSTVPLVAYFAAYDPASRGQVSSLARPGGNLTGVAGSPGVELPRKRMQMLKELAPQTRVIALLASGAQLEMFPPDSGPAGTRVVPVVADTLDQFDQAFASILREGCDALNLVGSSVHFLHRSRIIDFATTNRLPAAYAERTFAQDGGLLTYGSNVLSLYGQMAGLVDQILRGARPADLPVQLPDRFDLVINRRTADALGLTIPPSLEAAAEVIE